MARPIQNIKAAKASIDKWARMRQVAADEPQEADSALAEVAEALGTMADALSNLRENLDLIEETPKTASAKVRLDAVSKYASRFRRMANEEPEVVAEAISEVYHSLDDVAGALESLAENMGIELSLTPAEEAFAEEGKEELAGEVPEEPGEVEVNETEFAEGEEELKSPEGEAAEEEIEKEAAGSANEAFTTDRDENGEPKEPVLAAAKECSQCGPGHEDPKKPGYCERHGKKIPKAKKADGSAGFVTDRDQNAKPEAPAKTEAPEAQGESELNKAAARREAVRQRIAKRWHVEV